MGSPHSFFWGKDLRQAEALEAVRGVAQRVTDGRGFELVDVEKRTGFNKAAVALANKLARIVWAVWRDGDGVYVPRPTAE